MSRLVVLDLDDPDTLRQLGEAIGRHITTGPAPAPALVVTANEAARMLGRSGAWVKGNLTPAACSTPSRTLYPRSEVERWATPTSQETP